MMWMLARALPRSCPRSATSTSRSWCSSSTRRTCCSTTRARRSSSRSSRWCAWSARRASASSSSRRARRTCRPTCWASSATACSTRCAPSRRTTRRRCKAAARTFPKTPFYDVEETLTTLGIGEALVTVLGANGVPTPPFVDPDGPARLAHGAADADGAARRCSPRAQVRQYATAVDRESAYEILGQRIATPRRRRRRARPEAPTPTPARPKRPRRARSESAWSEALRSPVARTIANQVTRGLMGALLGKPPRRRRTRPAW